MLRVAGPERQQQRAWYDAWSDLGGLEFTRAVGRAIDRFNWPRAEQTEQQIFYADEQYRETGDERYKQFADENRALLRRQEQERMIYQEARRALTDGDRGRLAAALRKIPGTEDVRAMLGA